MASGPPSWRAAASTTSAATSTAAAASSRSALDTALNLISAPSGHDRHQGREDDGVVARVDAGQLGQVVAHGPRSRAGLRLGPGVDDVEPGIAGQGRELGAHVGAE